MAIKINQIRNLLASGGGVAFSNTYKVSFERGSQHGDTTFILFDRLKQVLVNFDENKLKGDAADTNQASIISLMCDEATLPGVQAATGTINGIYTGSGQYKYPHTRIYNDLTLSWICDANMTPLKFLQVWMETIFNEYDKGGYLYKSFNQKNSSNVNSRHRNRSTRLSYPDEYMLQLSILKAEKNSISEVGRPSIRYVFDGVFPYAVETIPLSFGTSQLVKVRANFYYEKWYPYYIDAWKPTTSINDGDRTI